MKPLLFIYSITSILFWNCLSGQTTDPLLFPKDQFTLETKIVNTSSGVKNVTYRSYQHILYVSNPVDKDYQSMNIRVPVNIDSKEIDASQAPILFVIGVGGYMSVNNTRVGFMPRPGKNELSDRPDLALAAGYVVVSPGCRGRDNKSSDGTFYGKAPAAIVDLKAAVRYIRHNKGIIPGNTDWIVSVGCSAGGALSALLGTSGNIGLFESYLEKTGAAKEKDNIFGSACFSPITDLDHADGAYEWMYGTTPARSGIVNQDLSLQLKELNSQYQQSLHLQGRNGFGQITAENYDSYLLVNYLQPSATHYLKALTPEKREGYLLQNKWVKWENNAAFFSFKDYVSHVGRMKGLPAFDDFNLKQPEPGLFGTATTDTRHFTDFSLQQSTGNKNAHLDTELSELVKMMNAMNFIDNGDNCAGNWWLRNGTSDNHTSQTVMINLATSLENQHKKVDASLFWDGGHCADDEPENFIAWIGKITGYSIKPK